MADHWKRKHEENGRNTAQASLRELGIADGQSLDSIALGDLGFEEGEETDPDALVAAIQERMSPWPMIPQILCTFWPGDSDVLELLWDYEATDLSPNQSLTTLGLLNAGKFATPEVDAFRISQLARPSDEAVASVAVMLAARGLARTQPIDALPHLISAGMEHGSARGDILIAVAAYGDDELAPYARELQSFLGNRMPPRHMDAETEAFERLKSIVENPANERR